MALRLNGSSSGYVELEVPADAGSHTLTLPDSGGSNGQVLSTNGSGVLSFVDQTTDTGTTWTTLAEDANGETALLLENIPAEAEQIIIAYYDLSPNTTASMRIRLGTSSGIDSTSDYDMFRGIFGQSTGGGAQTTTFFGMENYTGADIEAVCREAALISMRDEKKTVTRKHFETAVERVRPTVNDEMMQYYSKLEETLTSGLESVKRSSGTISGIELI